jgi:hypothetical protein
MCSRPSRRCNCADAALSSWVSACAQRLRQHRHPRLAVALPFPGAAQRQRQVARIAPGIVQPQPVTQQVQPALALRLIQLLGRGVEGVERGAQPAHHIEAKDRRVVVLVGGLCGGHISPR